MLKDMIHLISTLMSVLERLKSCQTCGALVMKEDEGKHREYHTADWMTMNEADNPLTFEEGKVSS